MGLPLLQISNAVAALQVEDKSGVLPRPFGGVALLGVVGVAVDLARDTVLICTPDEFGCCWRLRTVDIRIPAMVEDRKGVRSQA